MYVACSQVDAEDQLGLITVLAGGDVSQYIFNLFRHGHIPKVFSSDVTIQQKRGGIGIDIDLERFGLLLIAKDKPTLLKGLKAEESFLFLSTTGQISVARGKYEKESHSTAYNKRKFALAMPGGAKRLEAKMAAQSGKVASGASNKEIRNMLHHQVLSDRGYFVFVAARAFVQGNPSGASTIMFAQRATAGSLLAHLNHGRDINYTMKERSFD